MIFHDRGHVVIEPENDIEIENEAEHCQVFHPHVVPLTSVAKGVAPQYHDLFDVIRHPEKAADLVIRAEATILRSAVSTWGESVEVGVCSCGQGFYRHVRGNGTAGLQC